MSVNHLPSLTCIVITKQKYDILLCCCDRSTNSFTSEAQEDVRLRTVSSRLPTKEVPCMLGLVGPPQQKTAESSLRAFDFATGLRQQEERRT